MENKLAKRFAGISKRWRDLNSLHTYPKNVQDSETEIWSHLGHNSYIIQTQKHYQFIAKFSVEKCLSLSGEKITKLFWIIRKSRVTRNLTLSWTWNFVAAITSERFCAPLERSFFDSQRVRSYYFVFILSPFEGDRSSPTHLVCQRLKLHNFSLSCADDILLLSIAALLLTFASQLMTVHKHKVN